MEIRKSIPNYKGFYEITNNGIIYSINRPIEKIIKPYIVKGGYLIIRLCKNGIHKRYMVHRLVLETFKKPCPLGLECAHLNGIPNDNRPSNLTWVTRKENINHRDIHGTTAKGNRHGMRIHKGLTAGEKNGRAKLTKEEVKGIRKLRNIFRITHIKLAKCFKVSESCIQHILNNRNWKFIEDGRIKE